LHKHERRTKLRLLRSFDSLADDRITRAAIACQCREGDASHGFFDVRHAVEALHFIGGDQVLARRTRAGFKIACARDLNMPGLGMDQGFAELEQDVANEAAAQNEACHAASDRRQRKRGARLVSAKVARRQHREHRKWKRCPHASSALAATLRR
jgi:hypothetical protein